MSSLPGAMGAARSACLGGAQAGELDSAAGSLLAGWGLLMVAVYFGLVLRWLQEGLARCLRRIG